MFTIAKDVYIILLLLAMYCLDSSSFAEMNGNRPTAIELSGKTKHKH